MTPFPDLVPTPTQPPSKCHQNLFIWDFHERLEGPQMMGIRNKYSPPQIVTQILHMCT